MLCQEEIGKQRFIGVVSAPVYSLPVDCKSQFQEMVLYRAELETYAKQILDFKDSAPDSHLRQNMLALQFNQTLAHSFLENLYGSVFTSLRFGLFLQLVVYLPSTVSPTF